MAKKRAVKKSVPKKDVTKYRSDLPMPKLSFLEKFIGAVVVMLVLGSICAGWLAYTRPATAAATPNHFPLIASEIGLASINSPSPNPAPLTPVSGKCTNCNGTGKVGDGTVGTPCPVCDGKGYTGFSLDLPPFPALETPTPVSSPPASLEPAARRSSAVSSSCASGSCGVAGNGGWRPFARLRGR